MRKKEISIRALKLIEREMGGLTIEQAVLVLAEAKTMLTKLSVPEATDPVYAEMEKEIERYYCPPQPPPISIPL